MKKTLFALLFCFMLIPWSASAKEPRENYGFVDDQNVCDWTRKHPCAYEDRDIMHATRAGLGIARYWAWWGRMSDAPGPDGVNWKLMDDAMERYQAYGVEPYVNVVTAPAWASEGVPAYEPWHCARFRNGGVTFNGSKPECSDPPRLSPEAVKEFVRAVIERYPEVKYIGCWNESGDKLFWPSRNLGHLIEDVLVPCYDAIKEMDPSIQVVGPEALRPGVMQYLLNWERNHRPLFDVISFHLLHLPENQYPQRPLLRLDNEFLPLVREFGNGRAVWVSSTGITADEDNEEESVLQAERLRQMIEELKLRPEVQKVFFYKLRSASPRMSFALLNTDGYPRHSLRCVERILRGWAPKPGEPCTRRLR